MNWALRVGDIGKNPPDDRGSGDSGVVEVNLRPLKGSHPLTSIHE